MKLGNEICSILAEVEGLEELEIPMDDLLDSARTTLEHLDDLWKTSEPQEKNEMARVLFPSGVACDKTGVVGTPQEAREIGLLGILQGDITEMAVLCADGWNPFVAWLRGTAGVLKAS